MATTVVTGMPTSSTSTARRAAKPLGRDLPVRDDRDRRHGTTVDDLVDAAGRVREVAHGCGRPTPRFSVLVDAVALSGAPDDAVADGWGTGAPALQYRRYLCTTPPT